MKKHLTFGKLFVLTTAIFITLTITFGFSKLFASDNTNCKNCGSISYLNGGNGYSSSELNDMRNTIKKNDYKFTVANNPATKYELSQICGLKKEFQVNSSIPDNTITVDSSVQASLPSSYDLRSNGLTSIKNQNSCGSCWAFATAGVVENVLKLKASKTLDLSEQWLVSCNSDNYSCSGGWWVFDMYKSKGAVYESDMPYTNSNGNCKSNLTYHEKIDGWSFIGSSSSTPSVDQIKQAIYTYGPIAAGVAADSSFQAYKSGTFKGSGSQVNHGIVLVGWDDSKNAWILRNSWGSSWGESGYMYIDYSSSSVGYGAAYVKYGSSSSPTPSSSVLPTSSQTSDPTSKPTITPTIRPSVTPTIEPSSSSTVKPTINPTTKPTCPYYSRRPRPSRYIPYYYW